MANSATGRRPAEEAEHNASRGATRPESAASKCFQDAEPVSTGDTWEPPLGVVSNKLCLSPSHSCSLSRAHGRAGDAGKGGTTLTCSCFCRICCSRAALASCKTLRAALMEYSPAHGAFQHANHESTLSQLQQQASSRATNTASEGIEQIMN